MNSKKPALLLCGLLALPLGVHAQETPSHLDSVIQQGQLTVCTTGDYKPYTYKNENGEYEGIDIAMARSLADSLGVKVKWEQTTWKTLMPDLLAGKCDIAMGGISVTLERQKKPFSAAPSTSMARYRWCAAKISRATRPSSRSTSHRCG